VRAFVQLFSVPTNFLLRIIPIPTLLKKLQKFCYALRREDINISPTNKFPPPPLNFLMVAWGVIVPWEVGGL